jgi:serine protease Do
MTFRNALLLTAVLLTGITIGIILSRDDSALLRAKNRAEERKKEKAALEKNLGRIADLSRGFRAAARYVRPSVVHIYVEKAGRSLRGRPSIPGPFGDFFGEDFLRRFFGDRYGRQFKQRGLGTGVIVSREGYILTNNHVVAGAASIKVKRHDGRIHEAALRGTDPKTDLAVIKIDGEDIEPADLGDSDEIEVGDWVLAAGNPFGLEQTVTAGIISAVGRANVGVAEYEDFIQTDAAINPGNSGGPLVNLKGEVIGITTAISSRSGGSQGVGFAIPINMAKVVMKALIEYGRVTRGWLGVYIRDVARKEAEKLALPQGRGARIERVVRNSPAEKSGLKEGDIIVRIDDQPIKGANNLKNLVAIIPVGKAVNVIVRRDGKKETVTVRIGNRQEGAALADRPEESAAIGITVADLTPEISRRYGYDLRRGGVLIVRVEPGSLAARAGLRKGALILEVNRQPVRNLEAFSALMARADLRKGIRLLMKEGSWLRDVLLRR